MKRLGGVEGVEEAWRGRKKGKRVWKMCDGGGRGFGGAENFITKSYETSLHRLYQTSLIDLCVLVQIERKIHNRKTFQEPWPSSGPVSTLRRSEIRQHRNSDKVGMH